MRRLSLDQWCAELERQIAAVKPAIEVALNKIGEGVAAVAREKVGHYQDAAGPLAAWDPLAAATIAEKAALGYAPPDNPLRRTGELAESIGHEVADNVLAVGSHDPVLAYMEMGTVHVPPRSTVGAAMFESAPLIEATLGGALADILGGGDGLARGSSGGSK
jgi:hypothetical protein